LEKLDRVLVSRDWEKIIPTVHVHIERRGLSDHNPLIVCTKLRTFGNQRDFKFELSWLKHEDFTHKVAEIWNVPTRDSVSLDKVQLKLNKVKKS
jgi:hypothetical protein